MKKQDIIKVLAMVLFAGKSFVACANPSGIAITLSPASSESANTTAKIRGELNTILQKRITELHDEVVINSCYSKENISKALERTASVLFTMRNKKVQIGTETLSKLLNLWKELLQRPDIPQDHKVILCGNLGAGVLRLISDEMLVENVRSESRRQINEVMTLDGNRLETHFLRSLLN